MNMFKRWITKVGGVEFVHRSKKDACSYDIKLMEQKYNDRLQVFEMVDIDTFDEYAEALEKPDKEDCYVKAYLKGWNDAVDEAEKVAEISVFSDMTIFEPTGKYDMRDYHAGVNAAARAVRSIKKAFV